MTDDIAALRRRLVEQRMYLPDTDLARRLGQAIDEWEAQSHRRTDAESAAAYIQQRVNELLREYEMFKTPQASRGPDEFPDACKDCRHYGAACPLLRDGTEVQYRDRQLDEADTAREARQIWERQARELGCHRVPEWLDAYDGQQSGFVERGRSLRRATQRVIEGDAPGEETVLQDLDLDQVAIDGDAEEPTPDPGEDAEEPELAADGSGGEP